MSHSFSALKKAYDSIVSGSLEEVIQLSDELNSVKGEWWSRFVTDLSLLITPFFSLLLTLCWVILFLLPFTHRWRVSPQVQAKIDH